MIPGEEIRIDSLGDERFWYVSRQSQALINYSDARGQTYTSHRAFAMTIAQYEQSCEMRERAKHFKYKDVV